MTGRRAITIVAALGVVIAATMFQGEPGSAATCNWVVVSSPDRGKISELAAVSAQSPTNVWAVGFWSNNDEVGPYFPLIEHFDGATWTVVQGPESGSRSLSDISLASATDGWAVGRFRARPGSNPPFDRTLAEHFNGTAWKTIVTPDPGDSANELSTVWERAPDDVWAVGTASSTTGRSKALIVHYDGSSWSVAKTPHSKKWERSLTAIHARGATEAWAAGYEFKKSKPANRRPLALTWDGSKWTKVAIPSPGPESGLTGVFQLANNDVVAVGNRLVSGKTQSFNENYNHSAWKLPPTATTGGPTDSLTSLYYTTAAGSYTDTEGNVHPLVEREQGGGGYFSPGWDLQPAPDGPMGNSYFNDVWAGFNGAGPWAVGVQVGPNSTTFVPDLHTLIEHYDCTSESPSPSSSVTPSASVTPSPMDSPSPSPADSPSSTESPTPTP